MAAPSFQLTMRSGPTPGKAFPLEKEEILLGRDLANDIPISDPEISRRHARFVMQGESILVEDLGSTNGTFLNGQRVSSPQQLRAGDVITLGEDIVLAVEQMGFDPDATVVKSQADLTARAIPQPAPSYQQPVPTPQPIPQPAPVPRTLSRAGVSRAKAEKENACLVDRTDRGNCGHCLCDCSDAVLHARLMVVCDHLQRAGRLPNSLILARTVLSSRRNFLRDFSFLQLTVLMKLICKHLIMKGYAGILQMGMMGML